MICLHRDTPHPAPVTHHSPCHPGGPHKSEVGNREFLIAAQSTTSPFPSSSATKQCINQTKLVKLYSPALQLCTLPDDIESPFSSECKPCSCGPSGTILMSNGRLHIPSPHLRGRKCVTHKEQVLVLDRNPSVSNFLKHPWIAILTSRHAHLLTQI